MCYRPLARRMRPPHFACEFRCQNINRAPPPPRESAASPATSPSQITRPQARDEAENQERIREHEAKARSDLEDFRLRGEGLTEECERLRAEREREQGLPELVGYDALLVHDGMSRAIEIPRMGKESVP